MLMTTGAVMPSGDKMVEKLRVWLARKLLGKIPYMTNVTFYQTVCLDINSGIMSDNCTVELGHGKQWFVKKDSTGIVLDYYKGAVMPGEQHESI